MHHKKLIAALLVAALSATTVPAAAEAAQLRSGNTELMGVSVDSNNFPDAAFRSIVSDTIDTNGDGQLSQTERDAVTRLDVSAKDIASLDGIDYFTALTSLDCSDNNLTALDLSANTALTTLDVSGNKLRSLDLANLANLIDLRCANNRLTTLDTSAATQLETLDAAGNQLTSLNITGNTYLHADGLGLANNRYTVALDSNHSLDLSHLPGDFDASRAFEWQGATVTDGILTANDGTDTITYSYDCGRGLVSTFTLAVSDADNPPTGVYTISFDAGSGSVNPASLSTTDGKLGTLPTVSRDGYTFDGWYTAANGGERVTTDTVFDADTTLYAHWTHNGDEHPAMGFVDVIAGSWYYDDVRYVYEEGLMRGTSDNLFSPQGQTTRGQIVTILYRLAGEPAVSTSNPFYDVAPGAYYTKAVIWAESTGVASGYGGGLFGPNDTITREQLAALFYNYSNHQGADTTTRGDLSVFADNASISGWANSAMSWAVGDGIIGGKSGSILDPKGTATRAEVAAILHRYTSR
ncbi:MAG: S-layer homology domain-containing protein [Peptococcaceae bacterium]|nr:S-layer homology domain-containing protein [Peptococcaceae bacterium]